MAIEQQNRNGTLNGAWIRRLVHRYRRLLIVVVQMCLVAAANYGAFLLRFDGSIPPSWLETHRQTLPWLLAIRSLTFIPFGLYVGLWRYAGIWDLRNVVAGVLTSSLLFYGFLETPLGPDSYPRSIHFIDALLLVCFLGGIRLVNRVYRELGRNGGGKTVLVYGAGNAGEMIVRDMRKNRAYGYEPIGFLDDDTTKVGVKIHGVPVLGTRNELARIARRYRPQEVLIAIPTAGPDVISQIVRALEPYKIPIKTLPNIQAILDGKVTVDHIRSLAVEDLLSRAPVGLDSEPIKSLIAGRRILVTGAGGSIGSELCRQIAKYGPGELVLYERYENGLHEIATELRDKGYGGGLQAILGDITDVQRLDGVMRNHQPEIVFHAAAHKHVPLMEDNACEAVKNNVMGTRLMAEMAERHGVDRFILISTDKAVNPTSVMGATKRVAELFVQVLGPGSGTSFYTVRFGNVLASHGSVVPRFLAQIRAGGPVTITHPEMRRYFMLIPEAVELVLHAAAQGKAGEIYVLKMGEQIRLVDMARNLIRLAGFVPDEDIPITFTGIRPGEKLYEELIGPDEAVELAAASEIMRVQPLRLPSPEALTQQIGELERRATSEDAPGVLEQLQVIIPEFRSTPGARAETAREAPGVPLPEPSRVPTLHRCPACDSTGIHRSHVRSWTERVKKEWSHLRPYRCHDCGWRGWLAPLAAVQPPSLSDTPDVVDLQSIDAAVRNGARPSRPAFSPRNLS